MKLRKATLADGPAVVALYREAQAFLAAQGIDQWQDGYPNEETFQEDVARGESWVLEDEGQVVATACLGLGREPTYDTIYQGAWGTEAPEYAFLTVERCVLARARARPLGSSKSWSARPGSGACPACGGTPTGRTKSCSGVMEKNGAVLPGRHLPGGWGRARWPLRSCCNILRGRKKGPRWPLLLSCVGGYFSPHILLRRAGILLHVLDFEHVQAL